ncbi:MAG: hypothetical protein WAT39_15010 [Planctomycetota bacterium]
MNGSPSRASERGIALLAVLVALILLMLLALPFSVSMTIGADAAMRDVEVTSVEQASASVRELMLADAAMSHPFVDPTPTFDGLDEFPPDVVVPPAFRAIGRGNEDDKRARSEGDADEALVLLGGHVADLQRYLGLDGASPLLFANVLGLTTRLREDLIPEADVVVLDDADGLPESGVVWVSQGAFNGTAVGNEVIRYGSRQGNTLRELERGVFSTDLFSDGKQPLAAGSLVLDYRCMMAAAWPLLGHGDRTTRRPYRTTGELVAVEDAGFGPFTARELDTMERLFRVDTIATTAATWGRPERVFNDLVPGKNKTMLVKSALHLGAGSTVRLTNLRTRAVEYGLVIATATQNDGVPELQFPPVYQLQLLLPPTQTFPAGDTVVEPLVPAPVNVNTASEDVLAALCADVRVGNVRIHEPDGRRRAAPRAITRSVARSFAGELLALRGAIEGDERVRPFTGWQDFVGRALKARLEEAPGDAEKQPWLWLFRNLQTGRDCALEMGTAPVCFQSGPLVEFRAAASRSRSNLAAGVVGRHERSGVAAALPGFLLRHDWTTQEVLEEAFALDRRAPYWVTLPVNLGHLISGDGNDPAPRYFPHLVPVAYPGLGLGEPRYPSTDAVDSGFAPTPATSPSGTWRNQQPPRSETFAQALDVRGYDVKKLGSYTMVNTGPRGSAGGPGITTAADRHKLTFPFSVAGGFMERFAISFWTEPDALANAVLFDHGDGDPQRNRVSLSAHDGNLVFEVIGEEGLDPNPGDSPAGVPRTAAEWILPLAELGLPPRTPAHFAVSAFSGRPSDLSVAVDGMTRGKPKYVTWLTSALREFDPSLGNNQSAPNQSGNERYLQLAVEDTTGFPPMGVLRIGLELFEYSSINGNSFVCAFIDSLGGRGARQWGREHLFGSSTTADGKLVVPDTQQSQAQGVSLDIFPGHPVGSQVELYGYSLPLGPDLPIMPRSTRLDGAVGGFAVARGFVTNGRPVEIQLPNGTSFPLGTGLDLTWTGDLELADPVPTKRGESAIPKAAQNTITDAFATTGGYALLVQIRLGLNRGVGAVSGSTEVGGVEPIRYTSRDGNKLKGVQRAQQLPGQDGQIATDQYDGRARKFVALWSPNLVLANTQPPVMISELPTWILWVVPISVSVQDASALWDPQVTGCSEWAQLYPQGGDANDTEWVRYDFVAGGKYLCRANRSAWEATRYQLTLAAQRQQVDVGNISAASATTPPWPKVQETKGYIGYTPRLEADWPQIHAARLALRHRGDPLSDFAGARGGGGFSQQTSSHPQSNALVLPVHRVSMRMGNYSALGGRVGRHDRVALISGSSAGGDRRPVVEWHTVHWQARKSSIAVAQQPNQRPPEVLSQNDVPFQLVAFRDAVVGRFTGPRANTAILEPRQYDRLVKFPSGELPAAYCENPTVGGGIANLLPMQGLVDEIEVVRHAARDTVLDAPLSDRGMSFTVNRSFAVNAAGPEFSNPDFTAPIPQLGGLLMIDREILAFQSHVAAGTSQDLVNQAQSFTVAVNGRGLLNTQARGHDRGARVRFLTHRPAAILSANVAVRDAELPVQNPGALPRRGGTLLLGQELLHYAWMRVRGDQALLEMPRHFPPGADVASSQSRGLFRGRFGTAPQGGSTGEPVIAMPFRYWDRHVDRSDDPELAYFQLTTNEAPVFFRNLRWREETKDPRVEVVCLVRADGKLPWSDEPLPAAGLWELRGGTAAAPPHKLAHHASRLEIRFATRYKPGCVDLVNFRQHGWKTTARLENVVLEYEGQGRVLAEEVTAR